MEMNIPINVVINENSNKENNLDIKNSYQEISTIYQGDELVINGTDYGKINQKVFVRLLQENKTILSQSINVQDHGKIIIQTANVLPGAYKINIDNGKKNIVEPIFVNIKERVSNYSQTNNELLQDQKNISKNSNSSLIIEEHTHVNENKNVYNVNNTIVPLQETIDENKISPSETIISQDIYETPQQFEQNITSENINTNIHNIANKVIHNVKNENLNLEQNIYQDFNGVDSSFDSEQKKSQASSKNNQQEAEGSIGDKINDGSSHIKAIENQDNFSRRNNIDKNTLNTQVVDRTDTLTTNENSQPEDSFNYKRQASSIDSDINASESNIITHDNTQNKTGQNSDSEKIPIIEEKFNTGQESNFKTSSENESNFNEDEINSQTSDSIFSNEHLSPKKPVIKSIYKSNTSSALIQTKPIEENKFLENKDEDKENKDEDKEKKEEDKLNEEIKVVKYKEISQKNEYQPLRTLVKNETKFLQKQTKEVEQDSNIKQEKSSDTIIKNLQSARGQFLELGKGKTLNIETAIKSAEKTINKIVSSKLPPKIAQIIDNINVKNNSKISSAEQIRKNSNLPKTNQFVSVSNSQEDINRVISEMLKNRNDLAHIESYVKNILAQQELNLEKKWNKDFRKRWEDEINK